MGCGFLMRPTLLLVAIPVDPNRGLGFLNGYSTASKGYETTCMSKIAPPPSFETRMLCVDDKSIQSNMKVELTVEEDPISMSKFND